MERDKIVAAFSDALFVVECGIKSGTMHTVNFAKEFNKTIFTYLPEDISKGSYDGNNFILNNNDNAIKVENINDFLNDLEGLNNKKNSNKISDTVQSTFDF